MGGGAGMENDHVCVQDSGGRGIKSGKEFQLFLKRKDSGEEQSLS